MHDVFIVTSEGWDGGRIARVVYAADEDDAHHTHRDNYPDESIVAVITRVSQLMSITKSNNSNPTIAERI